MLFLFSPPFLIDVVIGLNMLELTVDSCAGFFSSLLGISLPFRTTTMRHSYCSVVRHQSALKSRNRGCQIMQLKKKFRRTLAAKTCRLILVQKRSYSYLGNSAFSVATLCEDFVDLHHKATCPSHAVVGKHRDTLSGSCGKCNTLKS